MTSPVSGFTSTRAVLLSGSSTVTVMPLMSMPSTLPSALRDSKGGKSGLVAIVITPASLTSARVLPLLPQAVKHTETNTIVSKSAKIFFIFFFSFRVCGYILFISFSINSKLALIFLIAIPFIAVPVALIAINAFPRFKIMMKKYDGLNSDVQENLNGIRVVKAFVREDYETKDFDAIADDLRKTQVRAEKLVILNMPIMQLVMYLSTIANIQNKSCILK
mgnify:CR=1 FL=1